MESTIYIFKNLHQNLPPLFPEPVKKKMADVLDKVEDEPVATVEELEDLMTEFGYEVWPWRNAYQEFFESSKQRMGPHFLLSKSHLPINEALSVISKDLREFTNQEILSTERAKYLNRVNELKMTVQSVKEILNYLREAAEAETDHPALAAEIIAKVRGFEHSLCELGPKLNYHEVENAADFFRGRRDEFNHLRGINQAVKINY